MMKKISPLTVHWCCFVALLFACDVVPAQTSGTAARQGPPPVIVSPEVTPDRRVTFRLYAPEAKQVFVSGDWGGQKAALAKDERGVWSATIGPLEPAYYEYGFAVDNLPMLDPANPTPKPMRSPVRSILNVPGAAPRLDDWQDVPHGTVRQHTYQSKSLGRERSLYVYTPPGYDAARERYPVLYLFHGHGDNHATWTALGRAHLIADNLLAQRKVRPMIIVMMDGHALAPNAGPPSSVPDSFRRNVEAFERDLLADVMPFVETNYRTRREAADRAIVGLSMGGGQSLTIGLNHPDRFAWVGGFSAAVFNPEAAIKSALDDANGTNRKLKLLWFACGKDDFLLKNNQQFDELLKGKNVNHKFELTEGNHSWPVWRRYLAEFMPMLFTGKG